MMICINCLGNIDPIHDVQIGTEYGYQGDPSRHTIPLCEPCETFLTEGDLKNFHARYSDTRVVSRE